MTDKFEPLTIKFGDERIEITDNYNGNHKIIHYPNGSPFEGVIGHFYGRAGAEIFCDFMRRAVKECAAIKISDES